MCALDREYSGDFLLCEVSSVYLMLIIFSDPFHRTISNMCQSLSVNKTEEQKNGRKSFNLPHYMTSFDIKYINIEL